MDEHAPAVGADQPLNRDTRAMRRQLISTLSAAGGKRLALAIELWTALAEPEQRPARQDERHVGRLRIEAQTLHRPARRRLDVNRACPPHGQVPRPYRLEAVGRPARARARSRVRLRHAAIVEDRQRFAAFNRQNGDPHGHVADRRHHDLDRLPADDDIALTATNDAAAKGDGRAGRTDSLDGFAPRYAPAHLRSPTPGSFISFSIPSISIGTNDDRFSNPFSVIRITSSMRMAMSSPAIEIAGSIVKSSPG